MRSYKEILEQVYGTKISDTQAKGFEDCINQFGINSPIAIAQFIAQVGVEQEGLRWKRELGAPDYFNKYDTGELAKRLGNTPAKDGDGAKYKGRGYIQLTGLYNYQQLQKATGIDFVNKPELLETEQYSWYSAGFYWKSRKLNDTAHDVKITTKKINGGYNHLDKRAALFEKAKMEILE